MEQPINELKEKIEAIARYLGSSYPNVSIRRYEDPAREVVGFHFLGTTHGDVEFSRQLVAMLPRDENAMALELHLRHAGSEIGLTQTGQRLIFAPDGCKREPI